MTSELKLRKVLAEVNAAFARADAARPQHAPPLRTMAFLKLGELAVACQHAMADEVRKGKKQ